MNVRAFAIAMIVVSAFFISGCDDGKPQVTKSEQERFANPHKDPPPEAGGPPAAKKPDSSSTN